MRVRLSVVLPFFLGIFLGTMMTSFLMLAVQSIDEATPLIQSREGETPTVSEAAPPDAESLEEMLSKAQKVALEEEAPISPSQVLSYNVLASKDAFRDRSFAIHQTWGGEKAVQGKIEYYVHPRAGKEEMDFAALRKMPVTSLESEEGIMTESQGSFSVWKNICAKKLDNFLWFAKLQDDVYLQRIGLESMLSALNSSDALFVGKAIFPSGRNREDLGLREGESYCHEACYVLSRKAVKLLCPKLESCQENARSTNEDVEIARCMRTHLKVNCTAAAEVLH